MKNVMLLVFLTISFLSYSQSTNDFVNTTNVWSQVGYNFMGEGSSLGFSFTEDSTLVNGLWYRESLRSEEETGSNWINSGQFLRQSESQVYQIIYGEDALIYDFSLIVGDTFSVAPNDQLLIVSEIDSITLEDNTKRKRLLLNCESNPEFQNTWIEGIGSIGGPMMVEFSCSFDVNTSLLCFSNSGDLLYNNEVVNECWVTTSTEERRNLNLDLHPNPTQDMVRITGHQGNIQYKVFSKIGSALLRGQTNNQAIDLSEFPAGLYFIEVIVDEGREVFKVVKN